LPRIGSTLTHNPLPASEGLFTPSTRPQRLPLIQPHQQRPEATQSTAFAGNESSLHAVWLWSCDPNPQKFPLFFFRRLAPCPSLRNRNDPVREHAYACVCMRMRMHAHAHANAREEVQILWKRKVNFIFWVRVFL